MDQELARDVLTFAPRPRRVVFHVDGKPVETELWNFMDLPAKKSLRVYELEGQLAGKEYAEVIDITREIVGLLCPTLEPDALAGLVPSQMQAAIGASHGVIDRPPAAESLAPSSPSDGDGSSSASAKSPTASSPPA